MFKAQLEPQAAGKWLRANQRAGILTVMLKHKISLFFVLAYSQGSITILLNDRSNIYA